MSLMYWPLHFIVYMFTLQVILRFLHLHKVINIVHPPSDLSTNLHNTIVLVQDPFRVLILLICAGISVHVAFWTPFNMFNMAFRRARQEKERLVCPSFILIIPIRSRKNRPPGCRYSLRSASTAQPLGFLSHPRSLRCNSFYI